MPIAQSDILFFLSGGSTNTDPNASLGGAISSTQIADATVENLFDNVTGDEAAAGKTEYRCFYVKNNHASITWQSVVAWILSQPTGNGVTIDIGLDPAGVNGTATTIADETTAPAGVTFSAPADKPSGLAIGNIPAGQYQAIWVRRTVTAGASGIDNDGTQIKVEGDTTQA